MDAFLEGTTVKVGGNLCYALDDQNTHMAGEWLKFECYGDGVSGTTITITQTNQAYPMSICGIKVYGNADPRTLLDTEYRDYTYDKGYEESKKEQLTDEKVELALAIADLEDQYWEIEEQAVALNEK